MDTAGGHQRFESARQWADLTLRDLWLRYLALGGTHDVFDLDGFLHGLVPLDAGQHDVLAVTVNERLEEVYRTLRIPLSTSSSSSTEKQDLDAVVEQLLHREGRTGL